MYGIVSAEMRHAQIESETGVSPQNTILLPHHLTDYATCRLELFKLLCAVYQTYAMH
jgi:hypothetical protein